MTSIQVLLELIQNIIPEAYSTSMGDIVQLNRGKMNQIEEALMIDTAVFTPDYLRDYFSEEENLQTTKAVNKDKIDKVLRATLQFRKKEHIEMLNFDTFRRIISIQNLKAVVNVNHFVNFTIQETGQNPLLNTKGYFLKSFLYFHLKKDMRFRANIDSLAIEMDNPYTRQTIREENRNDPYLSKKYLGELDLENFCLSLLDSGFSTIAGIWADHDHFFPYYCLEFIRFVLEYGFLSLSCTKKILLRLVEVTNRLHRLEEGWNERLNEINKLSLMIKANNVTSIFAKCRENISYIIIQSIVLFNDEAFMTNYPKYVEETVLTTANLESLVAKEMLQTTCFFDTEMNDAFLTICMNYLSHTVYINIQKAMNEEGKLAVEQAFLMLTSTFKDGFLNSLKQVRGEDLKYFSRSDVISERTRETSDRLSRTLDRLLTMIGGGEFDEQTGAMSKEFKPDDNYTNFLRQFVSTENPSIISITNSIINHISENITADDDFRVAVAKDSVPLMLMALADYLNEYFKFPSTQKLVKDILKNIYILCHKNNFVKGQLFKGDGLYHFYNLLADKNKEAYLFLSHLCDEENINFFLGKGMFNKFLVLYQSYSREIAIQIKGDFDVDGMNVESCSLLLIMSNIVNKIFEKPFLSVREKLQCSFMAQVTLFPTFKGCFLPRLIDLVNQKMVVNPKEHGIELEPGVFMNNRESELINRLEKQTLSSKSKKILLLHLCFNVLKGFNQITSDCFASVEVTLLKDHLENVRECLFNSGVRFDVQVVPFGLDGELLLLLKNFFVVSEENSLIEKEAYIDLDKEKEKEVKEQVELGSGKAEGVQDPNKKPDLIFEVVLNSLNKVLEFQQSSSRKKEAEYYLFEGLFPLLIKYINHVKNSTNFYKPKEIKMNTKKIKKIKKAFYSVAKCINNIMEKEVVKEGDILDDDTFKKQLTINLNVDSRPPSRKNSGVKSVKDFAKADKPLSESIEEQEGTLVGYCDSVLELIKQYHEDSEYQDRLVKNMDISKERFNELIYASKFEDKVTDASIAKKLKILNMYIKEYQEAKDLYLDRSEEPNLMKFFDRNTQNLKGVFSSCIDRMFFRSKHEKTVEKNQRKPFKLAHEYSIAKFWTNPTCYAYVAMLERLLSKSDTARKEFFSFVNEDRKLMKKIKQAKEKKEKNKKYYEWKSSLKDIHKATGGRPRDSIISSLSRIQVDLFLFMYSNSTRKPLWWITHQTYEMICSFFKNLCECNFKKFKKFFSKFKPDVTDNAWAQLHDQPVVQIFSVELAFLISKCKLASNKNPVMIHSDQLGKVQPILSPLLEVINEMITGPCKENQDIFISRAHCIDPLVNIAMRVIDDMESDYVQLANNSLNLLLSLTEGNESEILLSVASKLPPSILVDRINRLMKKLYIKHLIETDTFEREAKKFADAAEADLAEKSKANKDVTGYTPQKTSANKIEILDKSKMPSVAPVELKKAYIATVVTEEMEAMVSIDHWKTLFKLYMRKVEFSQNDTFKFIFSIMILWHTLATSKNRNHQNLLKATKDELELYYPTEDPGNLLGLGTGSPKSTEDNKDLTKPPEFVNIFYFISKKIIREIELIDTNDKSVLIYFPKMPECYLLSEEVKSNYRSTCDIADSNTKMMNLMRNFQLFRIQMEYSMETSLRLGFLYSAISSDAFTYYTVICWYLGVALNFILLIGQTFDAENKKLVFRNSTYDIVINVAGYILVGCSAFFLLLWCVTKYKPTYLTQMEAYRFENPTAKMNSWKTKLYVGVMLAFLKQPFSVNFTLHLLFTLLGLHFHVFWFTINLFLVINISKTTSFVISSIILHIDQLVLTLILAMFVIFVYSFLFTGELFAYMSPEENSPCDALSDCFFYIINKGFRNGGGIAESLTEIRSDYLYTGRTISDISFYMIINVISLNIIFGIIIDTFSQLRDSQQERNIDELLNCFVCGNTRSDFTKKGYDFDHHIMVDHDEWKYIYYIYYLKKKGEQELTGLEYHAWEQFHNQSTGWIPIGSTIHLGDTGLEKLQYLDDKMADIQKTLDDVDEKLKSAHAKAQNIVKHRNEGRRVSKGFDNGPTNLASSNQGSQASLKNIRY